MGLRQEVGRDNPQCVPRGRSKVVAPIKLTQGQVRALVRIYILRRAEECKLTGREVIVYTTGRETPVRTFEELVELKLAAYGKADLELTLLGEREARERLRKMI